MPITDVGVGAGASTTDGAQQCVVTDLDFDALGQCGGGAAAKRDGETEYDFVEPAGSARLRRRGPVKTLRKRLSLAGFGIAKETTGANDKLGASPANRQVIHFAHISTMDPRAPHSAMWTSGVREHRVGVNEHAGLAILDAFDPKARWGEPRVVERKHGSAPNRGQPISIRIFLGVQLQTIITIDENSALNAGVTLNRTFPNGSASGVTRGQSSNLGFGASGSTDVQRVDTAYTYWRVEKITTKHNIEQCRDNDHPTSSSSPLLRSNLGIEDYLLGATSQANFLHSSEAEKAKSAKLDVFSYELKFIVVTSGNINPTWKLVSVSSSNSAPFFNTARTRTTTSS